MIELLTHRAHASKVLRLGLPLVGSHLAQIAIHLTDTVMLGRYSVEALAGQVLGATFFFVIFIVGSGFALAVMPMVARAEAAQDAREVRRVTRMGLWISVVYGLVMVAPLWWSEPLFRAMGQTEAAATTAGAYLRIAGWALVPALLVMVLKSYLSALERTQIVLWVTVAAVLLNIGVNWLLIFGRLGFPELGVRGAAIASLAVNVAASGALAVYAAWMRKGHDLFARLWRLDGQALLGLIRVGAPIGLTNLAESGLFAASTVMMGWLGTVPLAAHGVVMELSSITFMIHLGISNAATIHAGQAIGRRDAANLRRGALTAVALSGCVALAAVAAFLAFPHELVGLFIGEKVPDRAAVIEIGALLMIGAGLFQVMDGAQIMALGLLRGVQDTVVPLLIAVLCYWGLGISASYVLGFTLGYGGIGIWLGLAIGLAGAATLLMLRFLRWSGRYARACQPDAEATA
ncbi:MATE family efflux transporter [Roseovarius sp. SCSIO 43702]|uniref:MATE family efflux transporter n=1 Tax=Roseovarius sp. SCSIO 43702 TaxID=2823043 RepID=UPI001C73DFD1|nr:MATE family efflux transporter [Roseovarius sp. SCSIO 43702]QYX55843.1 MATE family efflux transporter [Roseovarius sp. SCSIO 43702]